MIAPAAAGTTADPEWMTAFAQHVEACGFESLVVVEHTVVVRRCTSVYPYDASGRMALPDDCPIPDPLDLLTFLAARTTTLGLATGTPDGARGVVRGAAHHLIERDGETVDLTWRPRYDDAYRRTPAGWRFARRALTIDVVEVGPVQRVRR